ANALAAQATRAYEKRLRGDPERDQGGAAPPELAFCRDESAQATDVCERVLESREQGIDLRKQAVLMRTSHDSDLLELELQRRQIPFVKYGGLRYLEAAHVKDLLALFRLLDNPRNELAWFRVLQLLDGIGPTTARKATDELLAGGTWPAAAPLTEALDAARKAESPGQQAELLRGALAPLIEERYPDGAVRLEDLDRLVAAARQAHDLG